MTELLFYKIKYSLTFLNEETLITITKLLNVSDAHFSTLYCMDIEILVGILVIQNWSYY